MVGQAAERFGRYELVEKLGQGGMAEVWKAKIRGPGTFERTVVIKRILPQFVREEELIAMFMREAQLCSMLSHANIVQVHELGQLDGEYYIAMEYVRGKDVQAIVNAKPREPLSPGAACVIARDVGRALAYAYGVPDERGKPLRVIHRDVTPSNVMLTIDGTVKLVDFGVAKALSLASASLTNVGNIRGKLGYAAPEQLKGGKVDHRTDLFAVGVLVHELLTGRRLFQGDDEQETIERVLTGPIYAPSRINPGVPPGLDSIVLRAIERDPALRFQSGDDMADAFEPFVHQLAWGPAKITALLCARFPELDPALLAPTNEFDDEANTTISPPREPDSAQHVTLRPTASFVSVAADMGAWTTQPPAAANDVGAATVRGRALRLPEAATATREERPTVQAKVPRQAAPATSLAGGYNGSTALPKPPRARRSRTPIYLASGALALATFAVVFVMVTRTRPAAPPHAGEVPPTPPVVARPAPTPAVPSPAPAEVPETAAAAPAPTLPEPARPAKRARSSKAPDDMELARPLAPTPDSDAHDFDQAPIFTGKTNGTAAEPAPARPAKAHHKSARNRDGDLASPF